MEKKEGEVEDFSCLFVVIDFGVLCWFLGMKVEYDCWVYFKIIEFFFYDEEMVVNFLREISFGFMGLLFENELIDKFDLFIDY